MQLFQITPPSTEPVSLSDMKAWLRLEITDDDAVITDLISVARMECEHLCKKTFITQTWQMNLDHFPNFNPEEFPGRPYVAWQLNLVDPNRYPTVTRIPYPPLQSVVQIQYYDVNGVLQTLNPSQYYVSPGTPGRVTPSYGVPWPVTRFRVDAVQIQFTCGMANTAAGVPNNITMAIKQFVAYLYENRGSEGATTDIPPVVRRLLNKEFWGGYW